MSYLDKESAGTTPGPGPRLYMRQEEIHFHVRAGNKKQQCE